MHPCLLIDQGISPSSFSMFYTTCVLVKYFAAQMNGCTTWKVQVLKDCFWPYSTITDQLVLTVVFSAFVYCRGPCVLIHITRLKTRTNSDRSMVSFIQALDKKLSRLEVLRIQKYSYAKILYVEPSTPFIFTIFSYG